MAITARIEFTNHDTGVKHTVEIDWDTLVAARSASAEAWNASNRLCEAGAFSDPCGVRKAVQSLREYRGHHEPLKKVLGLADEDWRAIMAGWTHPLMPAAAPASERKGDARG